MAPVSTPKQFYRQVAIQNRMILVDNGIIQALNNLNQLVTGDSVETISGAKKFSHASLGFFGATAVAQQPFIGTVGGVASPVYGPTEQAMLNNIVSKIYEYQTALQNYGLLQPGI